MSVHIFDIDYTLVRKSTSYYFLVQGLREGVFTFGQLLRLPYEWLKYKLGLVDPDFIKKAVKLLAGIDQARLENLAQNTFDLHIKQNLFTNCVNLIRELQAHGEYVCFATSSFYTLIKPIEDFLGVKESIASHLEFVDGKTTGNIVGAAAFGHGKKDAVLSWLTQKEIPLDQVSFYTDSYSDIPLLELCGRPVAVNPDRFLLKQVRKNGWEILRFKETLH
jgi:HAD superfamily hydrolase (TIGR01490 family)